VSGIPSGDLNDQGCTWSVTVTVTAAGEAAAAPAYFEADSAPPAAAWPAASLAVSTRNGEQLT